MQGSSIRGMRVSVRFLVLLIPVLAGIIFGFNQVMVKLEDRWALQDLLNQGGLVFHFIEDPVYESVTKGQLRRLKRVYKRIGAHENFKNVLGVLVCSTDGKVISRGGRVPRGFKCDWDVPDKVEPKDAASASGLLENGSDPVHRSIFLLVNREIEEEEKKIEEEGERKPEPEPKGLLTKDKEDEPVEKAQLKAYVLIYQNPTTLIQRSETVRSYTVGAFLILGLLISLITLVVYRWSVSRPVQQLSEVMKGMMLGDTDKISRALENTDFAPLVKDFDHILVDISRAKRHAPKGGGNGANPKHWGATRLNNEFHDLFGEDSRLCVIAYDEPYMHQRRGANVEAVVPASGMVMGIEPVLRACSGLWIGHGAGSADHSTADKKGMVLVPADNPEYALKRVWLSRKEEQGFYYGFSSEGLWPLCHIAHERPYFRIEDWEQYVEVNAKFAQTFCDEVKASRPIVTVQGHHFGLVPSIIRKMRPDTIIGMFWHIPWPSPEYIRICPWRKELLLGMLEADLIGFQLQVHANNFLDSVDRFLEARVSRDHFSVTIGGHTCYVKPFPTSVEFPSQFDVEGERVEEIRVRVMRELGLPEEDTTLGLAVDRLDYTKGILERLQAIEKLLEENKAYVGRFSFLQVVSPSRMHLKKYQELSAEIQKVVDRINWKFYSETCPPLILKMERLSRKEIFDSMRAANFCFINSLHDGMNLVAKEYVTSRTDSQGVLILSSFTGCAKEFMGEALSVNPYDVSDCVSAMIQAIEMSPDEQINRMGKLREKVAQHNAYYWGSRYFRELKSVSDKAAGG